MSLNSEITRLQNAKATLKTKLNARNDNQHQITDETIDEYGAFVDSIPSGGGTSSTDWSQIGYTSQPQDIVDKLNYSKQIYDNWDNTQTDLSYKYNFNTTLVYAPLVDTSNCIIFTGMYNGCSKILEIPPINTSNGTKFNYFASQCNIIKKFPQIDISNATDISLMFMSSGFVDIPELNAKSVTNVSNPFNYCSSLQNFGGFLNLGQAYLTTASADYSTYRLSLSSCSSLTHDSLINVINGLYDIATKGCNTQQLILGSTNLAKLSASEISSATNKGWSIS